MMCNIIRNKITSFPVESIVQLNRFETFHCIYMKRLIKQKKKHPNIGESLRFWNVYVFLKWKNLSIMLLNTLHSRILKFSEYDSVFCNSRANALQNDIFFN